MKKLKVALVLLFTLSCSLFLFACGGGTVVSIAVSGQKTEYFDVNADPDASAHETFSLGDLTVTGTNSKGKESTLKESAYTVDYADLETNFNAGATGTYTVTVTLNDDALVATSYTVQISHEFGDAVDGVKVCKHCGAKQESHDIGDSMVFPDWGSSDATTLTTVEGYDGEVYGTLVNERWVKYGTIDQGQTYVLKGTITPTATEGWDTPMFAVQANGVGLAVRTDNWVINAGNAIAGYSNLYTGPGSDAAATSGTASDETEDWAVYYEIPSGGSTVTDTGSLNSKGDNPGGDFVYTISYGSDNVITFTYYTEIDGVQTGNVNYSFRVPQNIYDVLFFGEECKATISNVTITKEIEMEKIEVTANPTKTVYAAHTYVDTEGLKVKAYYSNSTTNDNVTAYAVYGEDAEGNTTLLKAGTTQSNPITRDMVKFFVQYGDEKIYLDSTHSTDGSGTVLLSVVGSPITSVNNTYTYVEHENMDTLLLNNVSASYVYDVNAEGKLAIIGSGSPDVGYAGNGSISGYYVAFRIVGDATDTIYDSDELISAAVDAVTDEDGNVTTPAVDAVYAEEYSFSGFGESAYAFYGENAITVMIALQTASDLVNGTLTFQSKETGVVTLNIDLTGMTIADVNAYVSGNTTTIDAGGTFTVDYYGITESDINDYTFFFNNSSKSGSAITVGTAVNAGLTDDYTIRGEFVTEGSNKVYRVFYTVPAINVTVANVNLAISVTAYKASAGQSNENPAAEANLIYNVALSGNAAANGWYEAAENTYFVSSGNYFAVVVAEQGEYLAGSVKNLSVNLQNSTGVAYDLSFTATNSGISFQGANEYTKNASGVVAVAGTIGDNTDGDYAALYIANVKLSDFGLSLSDGYCVELSTDHTNSTEYSFVRFTSDGAGEITVSISDSNVTTTSIGITCITDELKYYTYGEFDFGQVVGKLADGNHTWSYDSDVKAQVCERCGSVHYIDSEDKDTIAAGDTIGAIEAATENGITIGFNLKNATSDWAPAVATADNVAITLPNLDAYWQTAAGGTAVGFPSTGNAYPSAKATYYNGFGTTDDFAGYEYFLNTECYVTITISSVSGITWYKNGVKVLSYPATTLLDDTVTVETFANYILAAAEEGTLVFAPEINGAQVTDVSDLTVYPAALSERLVYETYFDYDVEIGDTTYRIATLETANLVNTDTSVDWWDGGTSTFAVPNGDFIVVYKYENTRDPNWYQDAVIEFYDANGNYFDMHFMCAGGWGTLVEATSSHTTTWTKNGTTLEVAPTQGDEANGAFEGDYTVTVIRNGSTLTVVQEIVNTDGDVYQAVDVFTGFTTSALTALITGDPYWLDNMVAWVGTYQIVDDET